MYIKKSRIIIGVIAVVIITSFLTIAVINPFGIGNIGEFLKFSAVSRLIENSYYEDMDKKESAEYAAAGVAAATGDPYTMYLWGDDAQAYMEEVSGDYCGVGMYIEKDADENLISVVSAIAGGPAEAAGIVTGDKILSIDGRSYTGEELTEAAYYMKGEEGTEVTLLIRKASDNSETEIKLIRSKIELASVDSKMVDNSIGYISITQFTEGVSKKFREQFENLNTQGMTALIIDLRNNPGGLLEEAVEIAGNFVPEGKLITYTLDKNGGREEFFARSNAKKIDIPIVILTNGGSASASEVLTGALRDYGLAKTVGEKTYGKGIVQSVMSVGADAILSVTVARYYSPNGVCIHGEGIEPDIKVEMDISKVSKIGELNLSDDEQLLKAISFIKE